MKIKSVLAALVISSNAFAAPGAAGGSITDLIAPTINVSILFGVLIWILTPKLRAHYAQKSQDVANTIERADIKAKEAALMLQAQEAKMANLDNEVKAIISSAQADAANFEQAAVKENAEKIAKLNADSANKMAADKKVILDELNAEILEQVIAKTKATIKSNKDYQGKVTNKMLQGLK